MHAVVMVMLYAGLRPAEAEALSMDDVDMEAGQIYVVAYLRARGSNKRYISNETKTKKSKCYVPIFSPLRNACEGREGMLITCEDGTPISGSGWDRAWESYKTAVEAELNGISKRWYGRTKKQKAIEAVPTNKE